MPQKILMVKPQSIAARKGIKPGETIISINGETLIDNIDYQALTAKVRVILKLQGQDGAVRDVTIIKNKEAALGLQLEEQAAGAIRVCKNKCAFCFIDQMPKGMRPSLYVKDDDWRLSLMMGNFVTLTNVDDTEFERIIRRRVSPLYVSVHTTDPALRVQMMKNPNAGKIMARLQRLKESSIKFHCQIVLCPGMNDGEALEKTLEDLSGLYPSARSAALVPVGLTKCRQGLTQLQPYDKAGAREILKAAERWQQKLMRKIGTRFVFPADELYCQAELPYPEDAAYEGYPQIENGVGLLRRFEESLKERAAQAKIENEQAKSRRVLIACGTSVAPVMERYVSKYAPKGVNVRVQPILNDFFGHTVTVTGLITGGDLIRQTKNAQEQEILIAENMLRAEGDLFLDDVSLEEARSALSPHRLTVVHNTGASLFEALLGNEID